MSSVIKPLACITFFMERARWYADAAPMPLTIAAALLSTRRQDEMDPNHLV